MSVLVTGGAGFVGLNVVEALVLRGEKVVVFDRLQLPEQAEREFLSRNADMEVEVGDICDRDAVERIVRDHRVQRIIHTAVITSNASREAVDPQRILDVNLGGTLNVMHAARTVGCERVVYVGSGAAYGKTHLLGQTLYEETSPSRPMDIYGISKFAAEGAALRLGELWKIDVRGVRLGTVFGPWEFDTGVRDLLSPQLQVAGMAVRGEQAVIEPIELWRDWVYSRDVATGLIALLDAATPEFSTYHLTSGVEWRGSFIGYCDALVASNPSFSWRFANEGEPANVNFQVPSDRSPMDVQRMASDIGFTAEFAPCDAYADYVRWIGAHRDFFAGSRTPSTVGECVP